MVLNKGTWDPKPRVTSVKGTNLKSLTIRTMETVDEQPLALTQPKA